MDDNKVVENEIKKELTLLYLKSLDLSGKTPEEIVQLYFDADKRVEAEYKRLNNENKVSRKQTVTY